MPKPTHKDVFMYCYSMFRSVVAVEFNSLSLNQACK